MFLKHTLTSSTVNCSPLHYYKILDVINLGKICIQFIVQDWVVPLLWASTESHIMVEPFTLHMRKHEHNQEKTRILPSLVRTYFKQKAVQHYVHLGSRMEAHHPNLYHAETRTGAVYMIGPTSFTNNSLSVKKNSLTY